MTPPETEAIITNVEDIPGLYDVRLYDGRAFFELTTGQLHSLARREPEVAAAMALHREGERNG